MLLFIYVFSLNLSMIPIQYSSCTSFNGLIKTICEEDKFSQYYSSWKKVTKLILQKDFIFKCIDNKTLPKGLLSQSNFTLSFDDTFVQSTCQDFFNFAASRSLDTIGQALKSKTDKTKKL